MVIRGFPEASMFWCYKLSVRGAISGLIAALGASIYLDYVRDEITHHHDLTWREYRRLLLNCWPKDAHDHTQSAQFYVERARRKIAGTSVASDTLSHADSYESMTLIGTLLHDMNVDSGAALFSSLVGLGMGIFAYVQAAKRFTRSCPPNKLMLVHWKHRGLRVQKRLFGLINDRSFLLVRPSWDFIAFEQKKIPLLRHLNLGDFEQCVSYIVLDKVPLRMDFDFHTTDGVTLTLKATLTAQVQENESEKELVDNAVKLAGLNAEQVEERVVEIIKMGVRATVAHIDFDTIVDDNSAFLIFLEQTIGHYVRQLGMRITECVELQLSDEHDEVRVHIHNVQ